MKQQSLLEPGAAFVTPGSETACASCGVVFWMTTQLEAVRRADHGTFYCPNGHSLTFNGETAAEKEKRLRKDAESRLSAERARADQAEASRRAWKGQATKLKNRAAAGNCPICGESVSMLARHVSRKHPDEINAVTPEEPSDE